MMNNQNNEEKKVFVFPEIEIYEANEDIIKTSTFGDDMAGDNKVTIGNNFWG